MHCIYISNINIDNINTLGIIRVTTVHIYIIDTNVLTSIRYGI